MYSSCPCLDQLVHLQSCPSTTTYTPTSRQEKQESCWALQPVPEAGLAGDDMPSCHRAHPDGVPPTASVGSVTI